MPCSSAHFLSSSLPTARSCARSALVPTTIIGTNVLCASAGLYTHRSRQDDEHPSFAHNGQACRVPYLTSLIWSTFSLMDSSISNDLLSVTEYTSTTPCAVLMRRSHSWSRAFVFLHHTNTHALPTTLISFSLLLFFFFCTSHRGRR